MKSQFLFIQFTMIVVLLTLSNSCKKDDTSNPVTGDGGVSNVVFNPALNYGTMTDQNGNVYKTITIGAQTWMAENLRVTNYRNGDPIPNVTDNEDWSILTTGAYCNYANTTDIDQIATYGRLYNWFTIADSRNIAPTGWHVATVAEWTTLITYFGGESLAGGKLKETGITHWLSPNIGATNESGFSAAPAGTRSSTYDFSWLCGNTTYWGATQDVSSNCWICFMYYDGRNCSYTYSPSGMEDGYSVRLIKD